MQWQVKLGGGAAFALTVLLTQAPDQLAAQIVITQHLTVQSILGVGESLSILENGSIDLSALPGTIAVDAPDGSNRIENLGTLRTLGSFAFAISAADENTILNGGLIETGDPAFPLSSDFAHAIDAVDNNLIQNTGTILTHGVESAGISANDFNTINNHGDIVTQGDDAFAVDIFFDNRLVNAGRIATSGINANGVDFIDGNVLENRGLIETGGLFADAVNGTDFNDVTNIGQIRTSGDQAHGISLDSFNTVLNSGSIETQGEEADGIDVGDFNRVTNAGLVATSGVLAQPVRVVNFNDVVNLGTLRTEGDLADAIDATDFNRIVNRGLIHTEGRFADGIDVEEGNVVTNSGYVLSERADAFAFDADNTLNLLAPSFIGGRIDLGTDSIVNIRTGRSHSILWDFSTGSIVGDRPNISGPIATVWNPDTRQFAAIDPTLFSLSGDRIAQTVGRVFAATRRRLSSRRSGDESVLGYRATSAEEAFVPDVSRPDHAIWAEAFGGLDRYGATAALNASDVSQFGVVGGKDRELGGHTAVGLIAGYVRERVDVDSAWRRSQKLVSDTLVAGLYGRHRKNRPLLDVAVIGGLQNQKSARFVNNNLAALGVEFAEAEFRSAFLSADLSVALPFHLPGPWSLEPRATIRGVWHQTGDYKEEGAVANALVSSRTVNVAEGRLGIAAIRRDGRSQWVLRAGLLGRSIHGDQDVDAHLIGLPLSVSGIRDASHRAGFLGTDATFAAGETWQFKVSGEMLAGESEFRGVTGRISATARF